MSHNNNNKNKSADDPKPFEEALVELESEKLYGLGSKDSDLADFASKLERGALNLFPEYQRDYVWKPEKASRLLATVLCSRFMPPVVLHERKKGRFDVVDGKQRLTSLLAFYMNRKGAKLPLDSVIRDKMTKILPDLKVLSKLDESYQKLNGLSFDDLSRDRRLAFESYTVSYLTIPYGTPKTDVFEVYEDINSGGEDLTPQQVRRAVYHGPYIKMIGELRETSEAFHAVRDPKASFSNSYEPCRKDSDGELILRAFAFRRSGDKYKPSLKKFLNRELEGTDDFDSRKEDERERIQQDIIDREKEFKKVMRVARNVFGEQAFRKKKGMISKAMWDAKYCAIAELLALYEEVDFTKAKDQIVGAFEKSLQAGFLSKDTEKTSAGNFVRRKDELRSIFQESIRSVAVPRDRRRTFPPDMKAELYERQNGLCGICSQTMDKARLDEPNYAHIDHIEPHSQGGPTDKSNAQLTHSECNQQKGAKYLTL